LKRELGTGKWMPLVADESLPGAAIYQNGRRKSTDGGLI
jgi:hypothetical protein